MKFASRMLFACVVLASYATAHGELAFQRLQDSLHNILPVHNTERTTMLGSSSCCTFPSSKSTYSAGYTASTGPFSVAVTAGSGGAQCTTGATSSKAVSSGCAYLPISASESLIWNTIGFTSPALTVTIAGITFNPMLSTGTPSVCMAFSNMDSACGYSFAFSAADLLKTECGFVANALVCGPTCIVPACTANIEFQLLTFGISLTRDLSIAPAVGFWNGVDTLSTSLAATKTFSQVLVIGGSISLKAGIGSGDFEAILTMSGQIGLDVLMPSFSSIAATFSTLASGKLDLTNMATTPGFQLTTAGAVTISVELSGLYTFSLTVGEWALTLGVNMGSMGYTGITNGVYGAFKSTVTLTDLFPPLGNSLFSCNGENIPSKLAVEILGGLYINSNGFGMGGSFSASLFGIANLAATINLEAIKATAVYSASFGTSISATVGSGNSLVVSITFGYTFGTSLGYDLAPTLTCTNGCAAIIKSAADGLSSTLQSSITSLFSARRRRLLVLDSRRLLSVGKDGSSDADNEEDLEEMQTERYSMDGATLQQLGKKKWHAHHRHHRHHFHHRHHRHHLHHRHHGHHLHHRHHRHHLHIVHRHHAHINAGQVINAAGNVVAAVVNGVSGTNLVPTITITNPTVSATLCAVTLQFTCRIAVTITGVSKSVTFDVQVDVTAGDIKDALQTALISAFDNVKSSLIN